MFLPIVGGFLLLLLLARSRKESGMKNPYTVESWRGSMQPFAQAAGVNLDYAVRWEEIESGGNPCAFGSAHAIGPDGNPREMGIAQLYNPDDLIRLKITGHDLRAYCIPGTQDLSRPLTAAEIVQQAESLIDLIVRCRASALSDLQKVGASWNTQGRDFYNLTKLQHGLPGISRSGILAVTKFLGHPPAGWTEFRQTLSKVKLDLGTEAYRAEFDGILNNAEKAGSVVSP